MQAVRGTRDILPGEAEHWHRVEETAREVFSRYGLREIRTPIFEASDVFLKGTGEETDIVQKEMYRFTDLGGNDLTLRPEGTPPVIRAYLEHNLREGKSIDRYYYIGPMFRYERPQQGRYRQFHQIGVEVLGSESSRVDAEVIEMAVRWLEALEVEGPRLRLNTVGDEDSRTAYRAALVQAQEAVLDRLCSDCRRRHRTNPMRVLDCKVRSCQAVIRELPTIHDLLSDRSRSRFEGVVAELERWGVEHEVDPRMVRGLDYYRETVFEITSDALGAQDALVGGGRYDGLVAELGGDDVPGVGFASGLERILLAMGELREPPLADLVVIAFDDTVVQDVHDIVHELRRAGVGALTYAYDGRNKKWQSRAARRSKAPWQLVVGPDEIEQDRYTLRRVVGERLRLAVSREELPDVARRRLARDGEEDER